MAERWRIYFGACALVAFGLSSCSSPKRSFPRATGGVGFAGGATAGGSHDDSGASGLSRGGATSQEEAGAAGQGDAGATQDEQAGAAGENSAGTGGQSTAGAAGQGTAGVAGQGTAGAPPDPCVGKVCNTPPKNDCESATKFKAYDVQGSCTAGVCSYASQQISCTCQMGACTTDPCIGVTCASPPAQKCTNGSTLTKFASNGTCSAGSCSYSSSDTPCAFGCANGACNPDPCLGVTCNTQKPATCNGVTTKTTFAATGTCSMGNCSYASMDTSCGASGSNLGCSGAGVCGVCKADSSCGANCATCTLAAPKCKDLGSTSKCVQCLRDSDCGQGVCDPASNSCLAGPTGCNTLAQQGLIITPVDVIAAMPTPGRGTLVAGTYLLTGIENYGSSLSEAEGQTLTIAVNGNLATLNSYENFGSRQWRYTATFMTSSTPPKFTYTCFATDNTYVGSTDPWDYTVVNATTLWLFLSDISFGGGQKYVFTKQ